MESNLDQAEIVNKIRCRKYKSLLWTTKENNLRYRHKYRNKHLEQIKVPFTVAAELKFRRSVIGVFLESFNHQQNQNSYLNINKLDIIKWNIKQYSPVEHQLYEEKNDLADNFFNLIEVAVKELDCITWEYVYNNLNNLRINQYHVIFNVIF